MSKSAELTLTLNQSFEYLKVSDSPGMSPLVRFRIARNFEWWWSEVLKVKEHRDNLDIKLSRFWGFGVLFFIITSRKSGVLTTK